MEKGRSLLRWAGVLGIVATLTVFGAAAYGAKEKANSAKEFRSDVITIDSLKAYGELEYAPVTFRHELHTEALRKAGKDCTACHVRDDKGKLSLKFKRTGNTGKKAVEQIYHDNCIGCHKEMAAAGQQSGATECGGCHQLRPSSVSNRQPAGFDLSLHARHSAAFKDKCETCHHQYDKTTKKLVYVKGQEESCRACHGEKATADVRSMQDAAHGECVTCHEERAAAGAKENGPLTCSGCHDASMQAKVKKLTDIPRMKRNQPDVTLVSTIIAVEAGAAGAPEAAMASVPFDHKAHEAYNDTCRVCHHKTLEACSKCHTSRGDEKGGYVTLEQAMHKTTAQQSCVGCHEKRQQKPECAGCHNSMPKGMEQKDSCAKCHVKKLDEPVGAMSAERKAAVAVELLDSRAVATANLSDSDIPEVVEIKDLVDQFQSAKFPHRKIVRALEKKVKDDKLAAVFHGDMLTLCQGCHHHSPASKTPPRCVTCHSKTQVTETGFRPGLKGAFHKQCMGCHEAMKLEKPADTACVECHKKKN